MVNKCLGTVKIVDWNIPTFLMGIHVQLANIHCAADVVRDVNDAA
jgi:hypothetical protein